MFRFATPIILVVIAVSGFFVFIQPTYKEITDLNTQIVSYNQALDNSRSFAEERDKLVNKNNSISLEDKSRLQKFLPDNVDNIRLILEIGNIASPYGMVLEDVKYDTLTQSSTTSSTSGTPATPSTSAKTTQSNQDYGTWNLEFSTQGTYNNFLNFVKDLESNLRIVDISSIQFSSNTGTGPTGVGVGVTPNNSNIYKYSFKIKTYWLKD
jgi:Tfp pilus assembly protein PilO